MMAQQYTVCFRAIPVTVDATSTEEAVDKACLLRFGMRWAVVQKHFPVESVSSKPKPLADQPASAPLPSDRLEQYMIMVNGQPQALLDSTRDDMIEALVAAIDRFEQLEELHREFSKKLAEINRFESQMKDQLSAFLAD